MRRTVVSATSVAILGIATRAQAGGLYASDIGSQAMQRAGAFVAKADDPTALWHNPAGLVKIAHRLELYLGANSLDYSLDFARAGTYPTYPLILPSPDYEGDSFPRVSDSAGAQIVPFVGASQNLGRWALGEGVFGPSANGMRHFPGRVVTASSSDAPAPQRYDVIDQEALIALPSLGAAYRITDKLDVGLRLSWGFATMSAHNAVWAVPEVFGYQLDDEIDVLDADFKMDVVDDFVPAFGLGVLFRPVDRVELGLVYQSALSLRTQGTSTPTLVPIRDVFNNTVQINFVPVSDAEARCAPGGAVDALKTCMNMNMPRTVALGGRYIFRDARGRERGDVELDLRWENWSQASDVEVIVDGRVDLTGAVLEPSIIRHGFRDVWGARLGGSFRVPVAGQTVELRAGIGHDGAPAPDHWTRADMDGRAQTTLSGGAAVETKWFRADLGVSAIYLPAAEVSNVPLANPDDVGSRVQPDPAQPSQPVDATLYHPFNAGHYESGYFVFGGSVTAWF